MRKWLRRLGIAVVLMAVASATALYSYGRFAEAARGPASHALPTAADATALDRAVAPLLRAHPGRSGMALLAEGARRQGLDAEVRRCNEREVHALISDGFPLIVMLAPAGREPRGHFVVATGSNPQTGALRIHSGSQKDRWISSGHWRKRWKKAGSQIVLLRPA